MPYLSQWVAPEVFLTHNGVTIYHTYKDDDWEQGPQTYWFVTDEMASQDDGFDVRELPLWPGVNQHPPFMTEETARAQGFKSRVEWFHHPDHEKVRAKWAVWNKAGEPEAIRKTLTDAIDRGLLTNPNG